jgi:putative colanic acid biosynthesis UDP-glucose lipid carrier transferase
LYSFNNDFSLDQIYRGTWKSIITHQLFYFTYIFLDHKFTVDFKYVILEISLILLVFILSRLLFSIVYFSIKNKVLRKKNVAIIGHNINGIRLAQYFESKPFEFNFSGFLDNGIKTADDSTIIEHLNLANNKNIKNVYLILQNNFNNNLVYISNVAENLGIKLFYTNDLRSSELCKFYSTFSNDFQFLSYRFEKLENLSARLKKRTFDILFSLFVIIFILSWLFPIIALIIKLQSKGPILFKQTRNGRENKTFTCYKFRSMYAQNFDPKVQARKNDSRITPIGKFLRKSNIDELPQFFNVLKGEMSVIGPRPHMVEHNEMYDAIIDKYLVRNFIKPGISGWAQVNGLRGETNDIELMRQRVQFDIEYIDNWSLMFDVRVIFLTIYLTFKGDKNAF